jgi:hypothetical protein
MTRSLLQPIRTRRVVQATPATGQTPRQATQTFTPATRQTLAAIGALWVSFGATSALAASPGSLAR